MVNGMLQQRAPPKQARLQHVNGMLIGAVGNIEWVARKSECPPDNYRGDVTLYVQTAGAGNLARRSCEENIVRGPPSLAVVPPGTQRMFKEKARPQNAALCYV